MQNVYQPAGLLKKNENNEGHCWWPYNKHDNPREISIHFTSQINKMIIQESVPNDYDGSYWPAKCISIKYLLKLCYNKLLLLELLL